MFRTEHYFGSGQNQATGRKNTPVIDSVTSNTEIILQRMVTENKASLSKQSLSDFVSKFANVFLWNVEKLVGVELIKHRIDTGNRNLVRIPPRWIPS